MSDFKWRDSEKKAANRAFEKARQMELQDLVGDFKAAAAAVDDADQLWRLVDKMKSKRYEFELKYDYRYSVLLSVFARLLGEKRISLADLSGLDQDKLNFITTRSSFFDDPEGKINLS